MSVRPSIHFWQNRCADQYVTLKVSMRGLQGGVYIGLVLPRYFIIFGETSEYFFLSPPFSGFQKYFFIKYFPFPGTENRNLKTNQKQSAFQNFNISFSPKLFAFNLLSFLDIRKNTEIIFLIKISQTKQDIIPRSLRHKQKVSKHFLPMRTRWP